MNRRPLFAACFIALCMVPIAGWADDFSGHPEEMHVHDAYARVQGGEGGSGAVFFLMHNNTAVDDRLIGASTDVAERAELHSHSEDANGVMMMGEIEGGVPVAAGEAIEFARGGNHVMLLGLTRALADGDTIALTLTFEVAGDLTIDVPVDNARKPGEGMHDHGAMHHDGMDHDAMMGDGAAKE
jgi:periplasmic copper chaperone A